MIRIGGNRKNIKSILLGFHGFTWIHGYQNHITGGCTGWIQKSLQKKRNTLVKNTTSHSYHRRCRIRGRGCGDTVLRSRDFLQRVRIINRLGQPQPHLNPPLNSHIVLKARVYIYVLKRCTRKIQKMHKCERDEIYGVNNY